MSHLNEKSAGAVANARPSSSGDDVAALWNNAMEKYCGITGNDLFQEWKNKKSDPGRSIDEVLGFLTEKETDFKKWRHNESKLDKVRSALKTCLGPLDGLGMFVANCGALAFPPSSVIFTSVSYMLNVFNKVSADFDTLASFFEDLHFYLDRLKILDGNVPTPPTIQRCLVDILTLVLVILGISTRNMKDGRGIKFLKKIIPGEDKELAESYAQLKKLVEQEEKLIGNQTLVNSALTLRKLEKLSNIEEKLDQGLAAVKEVGEQIAELQRDIEKQKLTDVIEKIKEYFNPQTASEYDRNVGFLIKDTATWIFQEEAYHNWADGSASILWISGGPGTGKSFISTSIIKHLLSKHQQQQLSSSPGDLVAYYYFRHDDKEKQSVLYALACMAFQLATMDEDYANYAAATIVRSVPFTQSSVNIVWRDFFVSAFPSSNGSRASLCLVFDGLDEADKAQVVDFLHAVSATLQSPNIKIAFLGRPDLSFEIESLGGTATETDTVSSFEILPEKNKMDIMRYIKRGFALYPNLRTPQVLPYQKKIAMCLLDNSGGMFIWVELMFKSLSQLSGAAKVLKALQSPPQGLDELYSRIFENIYQRLEGSQGGLALPDLFCWIGHSKKRMSLRKLEFLCAAAVTEDVGSFLDFDLEPAICTTYSSLLRLEKTGTVLFDEVAAGMRQREGIVSMPQNSKADPLAKIDDLSLGMDESVEDVDADEFFSDLGNNDPEDASLTDELEQSTKDTIMDGYRDYQLIEYQRNVLVGLRHASLGDFLRQPPARLVPHILLTPLQARSRMAQVALRIFSSPDADTEAWLFGLISWVPFLKELSPDMIGCLPDNDVASIVTSLLNIFYHAGPMQTHIIRKLPAIYELYEYCPDLANPAESLQQLATAWFKEGLARQNVLDAIRAKNASADDCTVSWMEGLVDNPSRLTTRLSRACWEVLFNESDVLETSVMYRVFQTGWTMYLSSDLAPPTAELEEADFDDCGKVPKGMDGPPFHYFYNTFSRDQATPPQDAVLICCRLAKLLAYDRKSNAALAEYRKAQTIAQGTDDSTLELMRTTFLEIATIRGGGLDYEDAIGLLEEYIAQDPENATAYANMGLLGLRMWSNDKKVRQERQDVAETHILKALSLDANQCEAAREYIHLMVSDCRFSETCDLFEKYPGEEGCELWIHANFVFPWFLELLMRAGSSENRLHIFEDAFGNIMRRNLAYGGGLRFDPPGDERKHVVGVGPIYPPKETALLCGHALAIMYRKYAGDTDKAFKMYQDLIFDDEFLKLGRMADAIIQKQEVPKACEYFAELIFEKAINAEEEELKDCYFKMLVQLASLQLVSEALDEGSAAYSQLSLNTLMARLFLSGGKPRDKKGDGKAEAMNLLTAQFKRGMELLQDGLESSDRLGYCTLSKTLDLFGRQEDAIIALSLSQMLDFDRGFLEEWRKDKSKDGEPTRPGEFICAFGIDCPKGGCVYYGPDCQPPKLYTCKTCIKVDLCDDCYEYLKGKRPTERRLIYVCNSKHEFLETPVTGWKGVTEDKVILFEGREDLHVKKWLDGIETDFKAGRMRF